MAVEALSEILPREITGEIPAPAQRPALSIPMKWGAALLVLDLCMLALAAGLATVVALHLGAKLTLQGVGISAVVDVVFSLIVFERLGLYRRSLAYSDNDEFYYMAVALAIGFAPQLILFTLVGWLSTSRLVLCLALAFSLFLVGAGRVTARAWFFRRERSLWKPVLVVGNASRVEQAAREIASHGKPTVRFPTEDIDSDIRTFADSHDRAIPWLEKARELGIADVVLTEFISPDVLVSVMVRAQREHIRIAFAPPRIVERSYSLSLATMGSQTLIVPRAIGATEPIARFSKRCLDIVLALAGLIVFSPIMAAAALAVLIDTGRPILYRQTRVGRNGVPFQIVKFRSMPVDAELTTGPVWTVHGDKRSTRAGAFLRRLSIDELPQIFNVLRGDMSIVGPRPERPVFVEQFARRYPRYNERLLVRPGITGWSHVHMPRNHGEDLIAERLRLDLEYIRHWSLFMDLSVVCKTAAEILWHKAN